MLIFAVGVQYSSKILLSLKNPPWFHCELIITALIHFFIYLIHYVLSIHISILWSDQWSNPWSGPWSDRRSGWWRWLSYPPSLTLWRISALIILAAMVNLIQPHSIILQHQPYHNTVQTSNSSFSLWVGWSQTACVRLRSGSFSFFLDGLVIGWCTVFTYSPISQDVKMCILSYIIIVFLHFSEDITRKL